MAGFVRCIMLSYVLICYLGFPVKKKHQAVYLVISKCTRSYQVSLWQCSLYPTDAPTQDVDMVFPTESMIQLSQELQVLQMQRAGMTG